MIPQQEILLLAMKAGQIQLENGAEIFRVEDTIMHILWSSFCQHLRSQQRDLYQLRGRAGATICQGAAGSGQSYQSAPGGRGQPAFQAD